MATHLASGCTRCRDTVELFELIAEVARLDTITHLVDENDLTRQ